MMERRALGSWRRYGWDAESVAIGRYLDAPHRAGCGMTPAINKWLR
jgi:hypothetical protein